jgi:hypothetical protein
VTQRNQPRTPWTRWTDQELLDVLEWDEARRANSPKRYAAALGISEHSLRQAIVRVRKEGPAIRARLSRRRQTLAAQRRAIFGPVTPRALVEA